MSLDTYKLHKLVAKGFDTLYTTHKPKWDKMVKKAAESVKEGVAANEIIRAGDVIATVEHGIRISKEFDNHLALKKLTQKYWATRFAEYIVEKNYPHAEITINPGGN
ncbi:MAG TPA: hypothetical protein VJY15_13290 [Candidatus Acidoferrum sp.]|nr:hypothetical protein [Candidatus Acidoferrum sp.]